MHVLGRIVELLGVAVGGHDGAGRLRSGPRRSAPGPAAGSAAQRTAAPPPPGRTGGQRATLARAAPAPPPAGRKCGRREGGAASGRGAAAPPGGPAAPPCARSRERPGRGCPEARARFVRCRSGRAAEGAESPRPGAAAARSGTSRCPVLGRALGGPRCVLPGVFPPVDFHPLGRAVCPLPRPGAAASVLGGPLRRGQLQASPDGLRVGPRPCRALRPSPGRSPFPGASLPSSRSSGSRGSGAD